MIWVQSHTFTLFAVFAGMLVLTRLGAPLGLSLVLGGVAMDLIAGASPASLGSHLFDAFTSSDLWLLLLTTALLLEYGRYLSEERNAGAVMAAAARWSGRHGRAAGLMILPAAVGLVPMPGGALVSAPLVDKTVPGDAWPSDWKSAVNYWFRHVWEYWWPLYPVVVVTLSIFHVPTWQYMLTLIPFSVVAWVSGYLTLVRPHLDSLRADAPATQDDPARLRVLTWSLGGVVVATLLLPPILGHVAPGVTGQTWKLIAMTLGMGVGLAVVALHPTQRSGVRLFAEVVKAKSRNQLGTIGGVMVFQSMLEASNLLPGAGQELMASGIPLPCVVALLPLIAGIITGVAAGFAGMGFPLVVGLMANPEANLPMLATLALAFGFGYAGMMLSPVHLCLVLTRNYFDASLARIYRHIVPCIVALLAASIALFLALRTLGW